MLVIGINYSPEITGIGPYTTGMAEHLAAGGASVRVLTGIPHYPHWRVTAPYKRRLVTPDCLRGVTVMRLRHTVPREMTAIRRAAYETTFCLNAALHGLRERPDLVLAVTPALGGALAGASVARRVKAPLVVLVQDLMAQGARQSGISGGGRAAAATAMIEGAAVRAATVVAVVSDGFRVPLEEYGVDPSRIRTLPNWSHVHPSQLSPSEARSRLGWPVDGFFAVHTGNMGFKQDLDNLVEAARLLTDSPVTVVLVGDGSQRRALEDRAAGIDNIRFLGLVDDDAYPLVLAAADVLLVNQRQSVAEMSLPSKVTSYLAAGRPIVAAIAEGGATHRQLASAGDAALVVAPGDSHLLAEALAGLVGADARLAAMGAAAAAFAASHLTRAASLAALDDCIATALERWQIDSGPRAGQPTMVQTLSSFGSEPRL